MPTTGETTIGMTTFSSTPCQSTTEPAASAAPTMPPISACDDDDGSPKYQVMRFQAIAPNRAAPTTTRLSCPSGRSTIPLPTVAATLAPKNEPSRLPTAASTRAARGVSALVETDVAIALAASWKPLV